MSRAESKSLDKSMSESMEESMTKSMSKEEYKMTDCWKVIESYFQNWELQPHHFPSA